MEESIGMNNPEEYIIKTIYIKYMSTLLLIWMQVLGATQFCMILQLNNGYLLEISD